MRKREMRLEMEAKAAEQQAAFEAERPIRLLRALARAHTLSLDAWVSYDNEHQMTYAFNFESGYSQERGRVADLESWQMDYIENELVELLKAQEKQKHLANVRQNLMKKLSAEELEALGLL